MYMWAVYGFRAAAAHFAVLKKHCPLFVIVINVELSVGVVSGKNKGCLILGDEGFLVILGKFYRFVGFTGRSRQVMHQLMQIRVFPKGFKCLNLIALNEGGFPDCSRQAVRRRLNE